MVLPFSFSFSLLLYVSLLQVNVPFQLFRAQVKYPLDVQRLQKLAKLTLRVLRERLTSASYIQSIKSPLF